MVLGRHVHIWVFPKIVVPQNGWFIMETPIKMDDLGGTTIFGNIHMCINHNKQNRVQKFRWRTIFPFDRIENLSVSSLFLTQKIKKNTWLEPTLKCLEKKTFDIFVVPKFWTKPYHPEIQKLAPENRPFACPKRKPDRLPFSSFFRGKLAVKFRGCSSFIPGYWGGHYPGILRIHRTPTRHGAVEQRSCNAFSPRPPGGGGCGFSSRRDLKFLKWGQRT